MTGSSKMVPQRSEHHKAYDEYRRWCDENGCYSENSRNFNQELRKFGKVVRKRPKAGGEKTTMLIGYRLKVDFLS